METLTISETAERTGLTKKAIRNRVDREQLRAVLKDGVRRIPVSELIRTELVSPEGEATRQASRGDEGQPEAPASINGVEVVRELIDRLESRDRELGEAKALSRYAESLREEAITERKELAVRVRGLEAELEAAKAQALPPHAEPEAEAVGPAGQQEAEIIEMLASGSWKKRREARRRARQLATGGSTEAV